jgi:hypothetical protein
MGIQSNIEASTVVFTPWMRRVADTGRRSRRIFGHHHRGVDPDRGEQHSYPARDAELIRQTLGPSGAFEDAGFCT